MEAVDLGECHRSALQNLPAAIFPHCRRLPASLCWVGLQHGQNVVAMAGDEG